MQDISNVSNQLNKIFSFNVTSVSKIHYLEQPSNNIL